MNELMLAQLERLLERAEPDVREDPSHRYALRRALLNSTLFERNRFYVVWTRFFMYTTSVVAGGAVVAVFAVSVLTVELEQARGSSPISRQTAPVEFVSFTERPEVRHVLEFASPSMQFAASR